MKRLTALLMIVCLSVMGIGCSQESPNAPATNGGAADSHTEAGSGTSETTEAGSGTSEATEDPAADPAAEESKDPAAEESKDPAAAEKKAE